MAKRRLFEARDPFGWSPRERADLVSLAKRGSVQRRRVNWDDGRGKISPGDLVRVPFGPHGQPHLAITMAVSGQRAVVMIGMTRRPFARGGVVVGASSEAGREMQLLDSTRFGSIVAYPFGAMTSVGLRAPARVVTRVRRLASVLFERLAQATSRGRKILRTTQAREWSPAAQRGINAIFARAKAEGLPYAPFGEPILDD